MAVPVMAQQKQIQLGTMRVWGLIPALAQWVEDPVLLSCGVGRRCCLDQALLWLWCRPAETASIRPLAWEPPHAAGAALKRPKKKKKLNTLVLRKINKNKDYIRLSRNPFLCPFLYSLAPSL